MPNDTTPDPQGDPNQAPQENWQERYTGLQKVVAKRDEALHTSTAELDALRAEHEQAMAELSTYRQQVVDASEEQRARQTYDELRQRFEAPNPTPQANNAPRGGDWLSSDKNPYLSRERNGTGSGWPV